MFDTQDDDQSAPIDRAALAVISRGDGATERRLLGVFRKATAADAAAFKVALEQRDIGAVIGAAHRVLGASRLAGATTLALICNTIAQSGRAGDWDAISANRNEFYREFERVKAYLDSQLDREPGAQSDGRP